MTNYAQTENGYLFAETQGPFAPENLPDTAENVVFSREFSNGEYVITVNAAPTKPYRFQGEDMPEDGWDVEVCTERREVGDDGGDTSEYEWETINHYGLTLGAAITDARFYIESLDPSRDFA